MSIFLVFKYMFVFIYYLKVLYNKMEAENIENEKKMKEISKDLREKSNLVQVTKLILNLLVWLI